VRTPTLTHQSDIVIAGLAVAAVADNTHPLGRSARTAHAWLDTLHSRYLARVRRRQRLSDESP
jgi:hypothetical protein